MKKEYQRPVVDKIEFCYRDQVVATSGGGTTITCEVKYNNWGDSSTCGAGVYTGDQA